MRDIKNTIDSEMNNKGDMVVLQNGLSWSSYIRKNYLQSCDQFHQATS